MKMKMKSIVCVFLLVLVLLEVWYCQGCWKHEREALMHLNAQLHPPLPWEDGTDCCQWDRVECNTTTGRVAKLNLGEDQINIMFGGWYLNYSDFLLFEDLKSLNLSRNGIAGCVENEGLRLSNLEVLDLSYNSLNNTASILSCVNGFSSLKSLYLNDNLMKTTTFHAFEVLSSKLLNLEVLDVSYNSDLANDFLPSLRGFSSLKELYLSGTGLDSNLHIQGLSSMLINLEVLDMSWNYFNASDIGSALSGLPSLKSLTLKYSKLTSRSIRNISKLKTLEILDLAWNDINDSILCSQEKEEFAWPTSLQVLGLSGNVFSNENLSSLSGLQYLKSLDLSFNKLGGSLNISGLLALSNLEILDLQFNNIANFVVNQDWSKLKMLEELDLSSNQFEGPLPPSFANMSSLRRLELSHNSFTGNFGSNLASLRSLEYLDFEENQFEFPISFTPFANNSNLKFIIGNGNKVTLDSHPTLKTWVPKFQLQVLSLSSTTDTNSLPLPNFLLYQYNLTYLDFTGCKLEGEFPNWLLENNTKITDLVLRNCSFTGTLQLPSRPLLNMKKIDVSDNAITGQIPTNNISSIFPNLQYLNMSINAIHGSIPPEFGQMSLLDTLDLSDNHLSGEIPKNISGVRLLKFLKLSNNKLDGTLFPTLSRLSNLENLFLDGNSLSGSIPSNFFNISSWLSILDLSNNHFMGKLPSSGIKELASLVAIFMSNNNFEGSIPSEFAEVGSLIYLDLSQNKLTGFVPSFLPSIKFIHLSNNKLSGLSKRMLLFPESLSNSLVMLDLSYNHITSSIQDMIQDLSHTSLKILLLKGNHVTGQIPKQLCQLIDISILDLSHNNFSGPIPSCLGKMRFENQNPKDLQMLLDGHYSPPDVFAKIGRYEYQLPFVHETANFTTKKRTYIYTSSVLVYMSGIDLSSNKLNGNIPFELGNLTKIRALNLSNNDLIGQIPATFSNLVQIESLDLSFNNLSGNIPSQLNELTSLAVFSVAHNNLSGATPERKGQFLTFEESSYEGNPFLCGPPLPKSCNASGQPPAILPNGYNTDGDNGSLVDMYVFCVSLAVSYTSVLLVIAAALYINPYWRRAWFYYIELISTNCYYFMEDMLSCIYV